MPCKGGPTAEDILRQQRWDKLSEKEREEERENNLRLWKQIEERLKKEEDKRQKQQKKEFEEELKNKTLENICFNSFMTVFLCKAMDIVVSNFGYKFVNADLEWWYKEHKARDNNNDKSILSEEELAKKMLDFNERYSIK